MKRRTRDQEIAGSGLTHCTAKYGHGKVAHARVPVSPSSIIRYFTEAVIHCGQVGNYRLVIRQPIAEFLTIFSGFLVFRC